MHAANIWVSLSAVRKLAAAVAHLLRALLLADLSCAELNLLDWLLSSMCHNQPAAAPELPKLQLHRHAGSARLWWSQLPKYYVNQKRNALGSRLAGGWKLSYGVRNQKTSILAAGQSTTLLVTTEVENKGHATRFTGGNRNTAAGAL
jgi:hypothetical protein